MLVMVCSRSQQAVLLTVACCCLALIVVGVQCQWTFCVEPTWKRPICWTERKTVLAQRHLPHVACKCAPAHQFHYQDEGELVDCWQGEDKRYVSCCFPHLRFPVHMQCKSRNTTLGSLLFFDEYNGNVDVGVKQMLKDSVWARSPS